MSDLRREAESQATIKEAVGIARKTWQEKYGKCCMCDSGDRPEWSPFTNEFIHRHPRMDRRCGNNDIIKEAGRLEGLREAIAMMPCQCPEIYDMESDSNCPLSEEDHNFRAAIEAKIEEGGK